MPPFLAELLGTMLLIILGDGVVANVVLGKTKGQNAGWIVITAGWAFGVTVAVYAVGTFSGAHLNPAVTIGLASIGKFAWASVPVYIAAQMLGAFLGAGVVWRSDRLRDQPGARFGPTPRARDPADRRQGKLGLGLCVGPHRGPGHRRPDRGVPV